MGRRWRAYHPSGRTRHAFSYRLLRRGHALDVAAEAWLMPDFVRAAPPDPMPSFGVDGARGRRSRRGPRKQGAHCLQRRPRRMRSCSAPISPAPPLAAFSPPTRATTSRRNPTTDIPPPSGLCSSSNSRPDLRRQRPVRCHHHAVSGSPFPRTGQELPKL